LSLSFITMGLFVGSLCLAAAYLFEQREQPPGSTATDRHSWIRWGDNNNSKDPQPESSSPHNNKNNNQPPRWKPNSNHHTTTPIIKDKNNDGSSKLGYYTVSNTVPSALFQEPISSFGTDSFVNDAGVAPTYWEGVVATTATTTTTALTMVNATVPYDTWGPCFVTKQDTLWVAEWRKYQVWQQSQWIEPQQQLASRHSYYSKQKKKQKTPSTVVQNSDNDSNNQTTTTTTQQQQHHHNLAQYNKARIYRDTDGDVRGFCRPGFVILGAGKCGTSSLYHYLTEHPQVLPAVEKQIHYFKYYKKRSMTWYLSHFPTAVNMLVSGSLMTGEASPGYLPYPDVAQLMPQRMPGTRLIVLGRNPLERAYSSFVYSYIDPHLDLMRRGAMMPDVPKGLPDREYLEKYLFTFEEHMQAELRVLQSCLAQPNGAAIAGARNKWGRYRWGTQAYADWEERQREKQGGSNSNDTSSYDMLADLDGFCYGKQVNDTVLRPQWAELQMKNPQKVIMDKNVHLLQSHLGRSIYVLPLEWWYTQYRDEDVFFVCTEELQDLSGQSMEPLRQWLGLPQFNFSSILQQGAFNVGGNGNAAYDKETSWDKAASTGMATNIPISDELREQIMDFMEPYNERLYKLVGKRCRW